MTEFRSASLFIAVLYVLTCGVCLLIGFFAPPEPDLLGIFITKWKVYKGLLLFISLLPALQISAIVTGFSSAVGTAFSSINGKGNPRIPAPKKSARLVYIRGVIQLTLICLVLTITGTELIAPILRLSQNSMKSSSGAYHECIELTRSYIDKGDAARALIYLERARLLSPNGPETVSLFTELEYAYLAPPSLGKKEPLPRYSSLSGLRPDVPRQTAPAEDRLLSVDDMYDRAFKAFNEKRYFDAHYYAVLASEFSDPRNPRNKQAQELASRAWNILNDPVTSDMDAESMALFARKREGYSAITKGDYLEAYYLFRDLAKEYSDPDITRYLDIASQNLVKTYFFLDETYNIESFEVKHNVYFSLARPDGSRDVVYIEGIAYSGELGEAVQYLRNFSLIRTNPQNELEYSLSVPFAKMIATPASAVDPDLIPGYTGDTAKGVPKLLLHGVGREEPGTELLPVYSWYAEGELVSANTYPPLQSYGDMLVLVMPFDDINLIAEAVYGPESMSLYSLWNFAPKAVDYGYSAELYYTSLIGRIVFPLLLFVLSLLFAAGGWNYRLTKGSRFNPLWILGVPIFMAIAWFCILFAEYLLNLLILTVIAAALPLALPVTIIFLVLLCFFAAILFLSQEE
jgi:hypothetical protein